MWLCLASSAEGLNNHVCHVTIPQQPKHKGPFIVSRYKTLCAFNLAEFCSFTIYSVCINCPVDRLEKRCAWSHVKCRNSAFNLREPKFKLIHRCSDSCTESYLLINPHFGTGISSFEPIDHILEKKISTSICLTFQYNKRFKRAKRSLMWPNYSKQNWAGLW